MKEVFIAGSCWCGSSVSCRLNEEDTSAELENCFDNVAIREVSTVPTENNEVSDMERKLILELKPLQPISEVTLAGLHISVNQWVAAQKADPMWKSMRLWLEESILDPAVPELHKWIIKAEPSINWKRIFCVELSLLKSVG